MRLYYIDESEDPRYYVRTALGVDAEQWNDLFQDILAWRLELQDRCAVPTGRELHACDLLAGRGKLAREGDADRRLSPEQGAEVFSAGLRRIEDAARSIGGVEVINVCLRKSNVRGYERVSLDRLLNRSNTSVEAMGRHAFLIFDEGKEEMVTRLYRSLRSRNPVPRRFEVWEDGERTRNIPIEKVIGGPAFPKLPLGLSAPDGRPHCPRPPQAEGGTRPQSGALGRRAGFRHPGLRPQPQSVKARPTGRREAMKERERLRSQFDYNRS